MGYPLCGMWWAGGNNEEMGFGAGVSFKNCLEICGRCLLDGRYCVEGIVTVDSLKDGEECWISNGVRGFQLGKVKLS